MVGRGGGGCNIMKMPDRGSSGDRRTKTCSRKEVTQQKCKLEAALGVDYGQQVAEGRG